MCHESLSDKKRCILPCKHEFHHDCFSMWMDVQCSCPTYRASSASDVIISKGIINRDIKAILRHWRTHKRAFAPPLPSERVIDSDIYEVQVALKHFLEDVYSVLNYAAIGKLVSDTEENTRLKFSEIRKVFPMVDVDWANYNIVMRNIASHRQLPSVRYQGGIFECAELHHDCALDVVVGSVYMWVVLTVLPHEEVREFIRT